MGKRTLTVVGQSAYNYKEAPTIRLHGRWLEGLGFKVGEKVTVEEEYGRLIVSRVECDQEPGVRKKKKR
ncbi:MAG: SymE family type I addiction module toxin [Clostridiales bacterium]|jgi:toxic protein SymE|nr:type I toxin-antitoxin system SymE family toxin [Eubacteriales bacterium]MDH7567382.1 SymE family type I addiction module toxin [Clostridiales bacterium]